MHYLSRINMLKIDLLMHTFYVLTSNNVLSRTKYMEGQNVSSFSALTHSKFMCVTSCLPAPTVFSLA